jgi:hypothetical protein
MVAPLGKRNVYRSSAPRNAFSGPTSACKGLASSWTTSSGNEHGHPAVFVGIAALE